MSSNQTKPMKSTSLFIYTVVLFFSIVSAQSNYPFQSWMDDFPSSDFYDNTIFDIVLPGSRSSGMITNSITNTPSSAINTFFDYSRISSLSALDQKLWSSRQDLSVLNQLRSGARFLDLQIEFQAASNNYYAYNGLLGAGINSIIDDINTFITDTNYGPNEIIILYLSGFYGSSAELQGLYDIFTASDLDSKMLLNSEDLTTKTLQSILDDSKNIIAFSDDLSTFNPPNTFFDSNAYLHIQSNSDSNLTLGHLESVPQVRTFVTSNIRHGWPSTTLNLIYWTLNIAPGGLFTQSRDYNSFREYNVPLAFELKRLISSYQKLRFGNILLVDFLASSDVVEQAIVLNYEYASCHDSIWDNEDTGCASQTELATYFKFSDTSSRCNAPNTDLDTNCKRSCGLCPVFDDIPNARCNVSSDCSSPLYAAYGASASGACFIRESRQSQYITEPSFCLGLATYEACGNYDGSTKCGNNTNIDIDSCDNHCSADYQCTDGYCNGEWSICMTLNEVITTTTTLNPDNLEKYEQFKSELPAKYRVDIAIFRPGDAEADYPEDDSIQCTDYNTECFMENLNANPYVTSILGLLLFIIILSILFCVCFTVSLPFWCLCDSCCKKCYCRPCFGRKNREEWSVVKRWGPCFCLGIVMVIVCLFAIEGIIANSLLHSHIFDDSDSDSFLSASNRLFDDIEDKFGSVTNVTDFITDNVKSILNDVGDIVSENSTEEVRDGIDEMHDVLGIMASNYADGLSVDAQAINPFDLIPSYFTIRCEYCDSIYDTIISVNDTLKSESRNTLDKITSTMEDTSDLVDATDDISNKTEQFQQSIDKILDISNNTQTQYNDYMDIAEEYDVERETYVTVFFVLMLIFIIFPIFGMAMDSKWCFKINWCLAMYCSVLLLLISVPFVFVLTLSGDFCVRLDEFEDALPSMNSRLGRDIFNNSVIGGSTDVGEQTYNAQDTLDLIDTCFDGGSLLDVFNLSSILDWSSYRQQMHDALDIDIAHFFTIEELESLQTEIDTLSTDEYTAEVNKFISNANAITGCQCIDAGVAFDRSNLNPGTQCTPIGYISNITAANYWNNASWTERDECRDAFKNASFAVQVENSTYVEGQQKIAVLQQDVQEVFDAYDGIYKAASDIIERLQDIGCIADPLFVEFDEVLTSFTNCGFMGVLYGDFKKVGCSTIFSDVYVIGRAIIVIAFMCLLIVLWSLCLDYVYAPIKAAQYTKERKKDSYEQDSIELQSNGSHVNINIRTPNSSAGAASSPREKAVLNEGAAGATREEDEFTEEESSSETEGAIAPGGLTIPMRVKSNSPDAVAMYLEADEDVDEFPVIPITTGLTNNDMHFEEDEDVDDIPIARTDNDMDFEIDEDIDEFPALTDNDMDPVPQPESESSSL